MIRRPPHQRPGIRAKASQTARAEFMPMPHAKADARPKAPPPMARRFDPVTLEILWRRLVSIVDESDAAVARTAFSSLVRDAHDYTCMFTDSRGRELAQGTLATPGQSGAMALGIRKLVQGLPARDGPPA